MILIYDKANLTISLNKYNKFNKNNTNKHL